MSNGVTGHIQDVKRPILEVIKSLKSADLEIIGKRCLDDFSRVEVSLVER